MPEPTHRGLRGDLWAQSRYAELVNVLGRPQPGPETELFVLLARLLSAEEIQLLLTIVRRLAEGGDR